MYLSFHIFWLHANIVRYAGYWQENIGWTRWFNNIRCSSWEPAFSIGWPVYSDIILLRLALWYMISFAWISMSTACPLAPPRGWWIMILEFGMLDLFPLAPAPRMKAPMDAASPKQQVWMSALHICTSSRLLCWCALQSKTYHASSLHSPLKGRVACLENSMCNLCNWLQPLAEDRRKHEENSLLNSDSDAASSKEACAMASIKWTQQHSLAEKLRIPALHRIFPFQQWPTLQGNWQKV